MTLGISEIFSSVQGEGKYVGCRQLFIRLIGCNLNCQYCDTNDFAHNPQMLCLLEPIKDYKGPLELVNPVDFKQVMEYVNTRLEEPHHSISITGGEPLLYPDLIKQFAAAVAGRKLPIFLETNGTLPEKLAEVIDDVDIISMDIKLPSDVPVEDEEKRWQLHEDFLKIAAKKDVYVKIVVSEASEEKDLARALAIIKAIDENILLILQPMSPVGGVVEPSPAKMLAWQTMALKELKEVRVIPQTHKMMNQQ